MGNTEDIAEIRELVEALRVKLDRVRQRVGLDDYVYSAAPIIDEGDFLAALYQERRLREDVFSDPDLFGEPAWDILLDLAINEGKNRQVSVTSACIASCVPQTTALRWITILVDRGLIERREDSFDRRRAFLRLSESGRAHLRRFIAKSALLRGAIPAA